MVAIDPVFLDQLRQTVGAPHVLTEGDLTAYEQDWRRRVRGRALAVVMGTLLILLVQNGLNLMQVGAYAQSIATGGILIFAMAIVRR